MSRSYIDCGTCIPLFCAGRLLHVRSPNFESCSCGNWFKSVYWINYRQSWLVFYFSKGAFLPDCFTDAKIAGPVQRVINSFTSASTISLTGVRRIQMLKCKIDISRLLGKVTFFPQGKAKHNLLFFLGGGGALCLQRHKIKWIHYIFLCNFHHTTFLTKTPVHIWSCKIIIKFDHINLSMAFSVY